MKRLALLLLCLLCMPFAGCDACDSDHRVPIRQRDSGGPAVDPETPPFAPKRSQALPPRTREIAVEGASISAGEGHLHAVLPIDLDGDEDNDVLAIVSTKTALRLIEARRAAERFELRNLDELALPEGCEATGAHLHTVSAQLALAEATLRCEGGAMHVDWVFTPEAQPRLHERVVILPATGRAPGLITSSLELADRDEDGHDDLLVRLVITPPDANATTVELEWLDRPGGFARSRTEPEATLRALAEEGRAMLEGAPSEALGLARQVLAAHAALCREAGSARVGLRGGPGLQCGRSGAAGTAAAVRGAALVRLGRHFEALDAADALEAPGMATSAADRTLMADAWASLPEVEGLRARKIAELAPSGGRETRYALLGFVDDQSLRVRDTQPHRIELATGVVTVDNLLAPTPPPPIHDPSGAFAALDIVRSCAGYVVRILPSARLRPGLVVVPDAVEALIEAVPASAEVRCDRPRPEAFEADDGGWTLLGWAPQGVVVTRGEELRVVPLDLSARPAGAPMTLRTDSPPPVPLAGGAITPDGSAYLLPTPHGLMLRTLDGRGTIRFLRPEGFDAWGPIHAVALAPGGRKAAVFAGGSLHLLEW